MPAEEKVDELESEEKEYAGPSILSIPLAIRGVRAGSHSN